MFFFKIGVVTHDGLLYVVGGNAGETDLSSIEVYIPKANTWSMLRTSMSIGRSGDGIAIVNRPTIFNIIWIKWTEY